MSYSVGYKQAASSAHTQEQGIILEHAYWGHLGILPTPGSLLVSLCVVWLLMLITSYRIFCSCWRETFQEHLPPLSVLHTDFIITTLKFGNRRWQEVLSPLPRQFIPSTALSLSQEQKQVQYRNLTISSKSPQITQNYRREDNLTQRDFFHWKHPKQKNFLPEEKSQRRLSVSNITNAAPTIKLILPLVSKKHQPLISSPLWLYQATCSRPQRASWPYPSL